MNSELVESVATAADRLGPTVGGMVIFCLAAWGAVVAIKTIRKGDVPQDKAPNTYQDNFNQLMMDRLTVVEGDNATLRERVSRLEIENAQLRRDLALMESAHQDLPLPMWLKDEKGIVLACNSAYETTFLKPRGYSRDHYVGHDDSAIWPQETADEFARNDQYVFSTGVTFNSFEHVPNAEGVPIEWHIIKYVRYAGGVKLGIAGIAIPPRESLLL